MQQLCDPTAKGQTGPGHKPPLALRVSPPMLLLLHRSKLSSYLSSSWREGVGVDSVLSEGGGGVPLNGTNRFYDSALYWCCGERCGMGTAVRSEVRQGVNLW